MEWQRNGRLAGGRILPFVCMGLVLVFVSFTALDLLSFIGRCSPKRVLRVLPPALAMAFALRWLFYRIWFHPRRPLRFVVLVLAASAAGLALVVVAYTMVPAASLMLVATAWGEYGLYYGARKWAGLGDRFEAAKVSRARWTVFWGNLLVALFVYYFVLIACIEHDPRPRTSRAKSELRVLATAIESYIVDHGVTPNSLVRLTTPVAYLDPLSRARPERARVGLRDVFTATEYPEDYGLFVAEPNSARPLDWILWSVGPDGDRDLERYALLRFFAPNGITDDMMRTLKVGYTYDPTNGAYSSGDIWRVRY